MLTEYRAALFEIRDEVAKFASEKGEGVGEELLVGLVEAFTDVTGQPNWGDLAYLVERAYFAHNRRFEGDRDKIRKRYVRFVKNFPRIHEDWIGRDWKCSFGLEERTEPAPSDLSPQGAMERFMQRFGPKAAKTASTKPHYGKIHTSMKR